MLHRLSGVCLLLCVAAGCERTAEGVKQDTHALAAKAEQGAQDAKSSLERDMETFRLEAKGKLEQLSASLSHAGEKADDQLSASKEQLKEQIAQTQKSLDDLGGRTRSDFDETKRKLNEQLAELGKKINHGLDKAGDATEKALDSEK